MRIALDARFLTNPQEGGFKTYTTSLVNALGEVDDENDYILYVDREPDQSAAWTRRRNFTVRTVRGTWPLVGMPIREQWGLRRRLVRDRPDVVHFLCNTATIGIRAPYVVTLHDRIQLSPQPLPVGQGTQAYRRWAMTVYSRRTIGAVLAGAARIIAVSRYERDALARECGVAGDRIVVTHEAAHSGFRRLTGPERVQAEHDLRVRLGIRRPFLVTVGYEPRKQIPTAIHALAALGPEDADLELVIVAAAPDRQGVFQTLAASLGVDRRIRILGRLGTDDVARLYNLADAFVFPSEREGFGLPPLEAMACGAPIIARRATAIPEVVGNAAVLIDSDDPAEWGRAIAHLRASTDLQRGLRSRGLQRAASFSWRRCAEQTLAVYRQAAEDAGRTGPAERR